MRKSLVVCSLLLSLQLQVAAQAKEGVHEMSTGYQAPKDPLVIRKLDKWQEQKFGLFMHWGTYTIWNEVESWSICPVDWVVRKVLTALITTHTEKNTRTCSTPLIP